ncbi:hypothetical protein J4558_00040 [Leptolyngbya sp. 15MV]|nr:hypothetical protein J4558_00040 [Leptolyngbya sp. 15MV]
MASEIDICNMALDHVSAPPIIALDGETETSRLCQRNYPLARDSGLRAYPWPSVRASAILAPLAEAPPWGFAYAYQVPADCLRVLVVQDDDYRGWRVEGRRLVTNQGPTLPIRYIRRETDTTQYDALLVDAIALNLAMRLCGRLRESAVTLRELRGLYAEVLAEARRVAGQEQTPAPLRRGSGWLASRF